MSKILVVGNSSVVTKTIETIRQNDQQSTITLFCTESFLPYDRLALPSLVAGQMKETQTHSLANNFFSQHQVDLIANEKLARISFKRKHLTTENKVQIDYDQLMIADLGLLMPLTIKGHQKKGVFDCARLSSVKELIKYLPLVDTVFVMATNIQGLNMACALHGVGKEVVIVSSGHGLLPDIFDEETSSLLKQILEGKGLRVLTGNTIEEILGDAEVKAVRLDSGKVMAAQMVMADFMPLDWRLVTQQTGYQKIDDDYFHTDLPLKPSHFGFKVVQGFCMGFTKFPEGGREYLKFDGPQNVFKKIFAQGQYLVGAVLFNAPSHEAKLLKTIAERIPVAGQEEALLGG
ncbi:MAG: FAD-dependent oxidoreductase [Candidatus Omnitrophica bacterium]|nr:FAD-dependent oxidoreductase [Candidatus Omnitrophota bacterium]